MKWRRLEPFDAIPTAFAVFYGWLLWHCTFGPDAKLTAGLAWPTQVVLAFGYYWLMDRIWDIGRRLWNALRDAGVRR
jgi:hypothetical protein